MTNQRITSDDLKIRLDQVNKALKEKGIDKQLNVESYNGYTAIINDATNNLMSMRGMTKKEAYAMLYFLDHVLVWD